jgi:uncharacterized protein (DUF983 family)
VINAPPMHARRLTPCPTRTSATPAATHGRPFARACAAVVPIAAKAACFAPISRLTTPARSGEELFHQRDDDAPPYMTIFVVGHIIGTFMILVEEFWPDAPIWLHAMVWPTITLILSLWFLPIIKGGLIAHQWALRMHGFETTGRVTTGQSQNK